MPKVVLDENCKCHTSCNLCPVTNAILLFSRLGPRKKLFDHRDPTDEGITGYGESLCHGLQSPHVAAAMIEHSLKPLLLGRSPFDVEVLWEEMYNLTRPYGQAGIAVNAISGVDIAIWDVIGRALNKPIHSLIGGAFRTEVTPYATGFYRTAVQSYPMASVDEAHTYLESGFERSS